MRPFRLAVPLVALVLAASGCGGDDDSAKKADSPARTEKAQGRAPGSPAAPGKAAADGPAAKKAPKESQAEKAQRVRRDRAQERRELAQLEKEDRKFDRSFKETPFEKLISGLPIRKPPLFVQQYTTGEGHKIYTAVDEKRFLCKLSASQRKKAVADFFAKANAMMRGGGVDDFVQVVTPLSETLGSLPALATARRGSVTLSARGRGKGSC